eukprot:TRINITY_DN47892_c0_g1_i1.p1 TRINITY_DN47892_c0_g1~~TRINITY_DN47892_c0_g1_i1.p1  ORF type:complete len:244 (-),score=31.31 TRINITY_DN47892_c0_g1_i1:251-982(-)
MDCLKLNADFKRCTSTFSDVSSTVAPSSTSPPSDSGFCQASSELNRMMQDFVMTSDHCVTIALPPRSDLHSICLQAVSPALERLTEYSSEALMESNLRVLDAGEDIDMDLEDDAFLRYTTFSGSPSTALRVYRNSSGLLFKVILHLRGLRVRVAPDDWSSAEHSSGCSEWFLFGLYEDVTELLDHEIEERMARIGEVAEDIRLSMNAHVKAAQLFGPLRDKCEDSFLDPFDLEWVHHNESRVA